MVTKPTAEQLVRIAGMFGPKLSPDKAVKRALQLSEAADRLLRGDDIRNEQELENRKNELERQESVGLGQREPKIPLSEAFELHKSMAKNLRVTAFKTERGFSEAMRAARLVYSIVVYDQTVEEWVKNDEPKRRIVGPGELTSRKAVEVFFRLRAKERKARDHARHEKNKTAVKRKSSGNRPRAHSGEKREKEPGKTKDSGEKRPAGRKTEPAR